MFLACSDFMWRVLSFALAMVIWPLLPTAAAPPAPNPRGPMHPMLEKALAGPMKELQEILFCTRLKYNDPHWYANIGYFCDNEQM